MTNDIRLFILAEKYKSLTTTFLVGQGRWYAGEGKRAVEYKLFKVSNGV